MHICDACNQNIGIESVSCGVLHFGSELLFGADALAIPVPLEADCLPDEVETFHSDNVEVESAQFVRLLAVNHTQAGSKTAINRYIEKID